MKNQAFNPCLPSWERIPDGEPHVFGDRVYVYGSHDQFDGQSFCLGDCVCWPPPRTTCQTGALRAPFARRRRIQETQAMKAPDAAKDVDGNYYLYYALSSQNATLSDTPAGKCEFCGYVRQADGTPLGEAEPRHRQFDPGVLVDDNGNVCFATGFSPRDKSFFDSKGILCEGACFFELEQDMRGGEMIAPSVHNPKGAGFEGHFFEASSLRKAGGACRSPQ